MKLSGFTPIKKRTVSLGRLLCFGLILALVWFPGWAWCEPSSHIHTPESPVNPLEIQQAGSTENAAIGPAAANPPEPAETQWRPLREIIQQYSETTGNQVRIKDDKTFDQLYSVNDPSWLEDFNRIEIFDEQTGKKEIILLGRVDAQPRSGPSLNTRIPRKQPRKKISRPGAGTSGVSGQAEVKPRRKSRKWNPFRRP